MRYAHAKNLIRSAVPGATGRTMEIEIEKAIRHRQLESSLLNPKGWPWQQRTFWSRNGGAYNDGSVSATQNGRDLVFDGTTLPDPLAGWMVAFIGSDEEAYKIESRSSATGAKMDRPYEGDTGSGKDYLLYEPYCRAPSDLYAWQALTLQAEWRVLIHDQVGHIRGRWPKQTSKGGGYVECMAQETDTAGYDAGTVTVAKGSAAVTGSGTEFPEWAAGHHFRLGNEDTLYRIKTHDGDTGITLDRTYGGANAGAGLTYAIDPPGAMQFEVHYPREDQYALRIDYWCEPQELVNDTDEIEGTEAYARALVDLATADVLMSHISPDDMTEGMVRELYSKIKMHTNRGNSMIAAMVQGNAPVPEEDAAMVDVRNDYGRYWPDRIGGRWLAQ